MSWVEYCVRFSQGGIDCFPKAGQRVKNKGLVYSA